MLGDRHVDDHVRLEGIAVDRPGGEQFPSGDGEILEAAVDDMTDLCSGRLGRLFDAAAHVAAPGLIAGAVENPHPGGARLEAHPDDLGDRLGIGVGGLFRQAVPTHVGFEQDSLPFFDKAPHAADRLHGLAHQEAGGAVARHRQIGIGNSQEPFRKHRQGGQGCTGAGADANEITTGIVCHHTAFLSVAWVHPM
ncbi:MAG: hypothetical protein BWY77_01521 [bacterium ADurb.Bin431]|nr:MAG: hypothetical protein BWY77_01521 [bacterium ADurb.Bin431]